MYGRALRAARMPGRRLPARMGAGVSGASAASYSTTFALTENPISEGGVWTNGAATGLDWSNVGTGLLSDGSTRGAYGTQVPSTSPPYNDSLACLSGFPANHFCQGTIYNDGSVVGLPEVELLLHWTLSGHVSRGYEIDILADGRVDLTRWNGTLNDFNIVVSPLTTNVSIANGAIWYAQAVNGLITVKCNGSVCFTYDYSGDGSTFQTGNPGLGFFADSPNGTPNQNTQANRHFNWTAFSAGSL